MSTNNTEGDEVKDMQIANTNSAPEAGSTESPNPDLDLPTYEDHLKASLLFRRPTMVQFLPREVQIDEVEFQKYINISENKQRRKHDVQLLRKIAPRSIVIEKPAKRPYHRKNSTTTSLTLTPVDGSRPTAASTTATSSAPQGIPSTGIYNVGPRGPILMVNQPPPILKAVVPSGIMTSSPVMPFGIFPNTGSATYGQIKQYQGESTDTQDVGSSLLAPNSTAMDSGAIHTDSIVRNAELFNPRQTSMSLSRQLLQKPQFLPMSLQNKFGSMSIKNAENKIKPMVPMPSLRRILPHTDSSSSQASGSSFGSNFYPPETQGSSSTLNQEHEVGAQALNLRHLRIHQELPDHQYGQNSNLGIQQWTQLAQDDQGDEMDFNSNNEMSHGLQANGTTSSTQPADQQMHSFAEPYPEIRKYLQSPATHPAVHTRDMDVLPTNQYLAIPPPMDPTQNYAMKLQEHFTGMQEPVGTNVDPNYTARVEARLKQMKQLKQEQQQINIGTSLEKNFECKVCWKSYYTLKQTMLHVSRHSEQEKQKYFEMARC